MKITKQILVALHAPLDAIVIAGVASLILPGQPFLLAAPICFVCAPPVLYITHRKMTQDPSDLGLFVSMSQMALIVAWILSLCFVIIAAMFMTAFMSGHLAD